jgi:hypothetical protein
VLREIDLKKMWMESVVTCKCVVFILLNLMSSLLYFKEKSTTTKINFLPGWYDDFFSL